MRSFPILGASGHHVSEFWLVSKRSVPATIRESSGASVKLRGSKMSTEAQRVDDSPSTSGGSSDGDQRESVQQEPEREQVQPKKKEGKISSKTAAKLSTSAKRIQKELAEITLDPPPNCSLTEKHPCGLELNGCGK
ncbi:Ubiquitin-conjugating enzyme E2 E2 [Galemys pyrenaicus]|uniref:Ubiquitin-conjugating enzyme E2 E2 n=1 Tax=Galemys pyrenaicus TaxID=202257 RepID=A0A8J6ASG0_GALPY|nr:Ubiquitin-conjugating enzyme E2 E2 [Galemys pyrenaicus]